MRYDHIASTYTLEYTFKKKCLHLNIFENINYNAFELIIYRSYSCLNNIMYYINVKYVFIN